MISQANVGLRADTSELINKKEKILLGFCFISCTKWAFSDKRIAGMRDDSVTGLPVACNGSRLSSRVLLPARWLQD